MPFAKPDKKAAVYIGTSGWNYPDWGAFYVRRRGTYGRLSFYAGKFASTENNGSFYHMPRPATLRRMGEAVPSGFLVSLKAPRLFTHERHLKLDQQTRGKLKYFLGSAAALENKLGAILIQTPPQMAFQKNTLLKFLSYYLEVSGLLGVRVDTAMEFRHQSWFNPVVYAILKKHGIALAAAQSAYFPCRRVLTADFPYLRFHGPGAMFSSAYSDDQLGSWAQYMAKIAPQTRRIYAYFNNTKNAYAPHDAERLMKLLRVSKKPPQSGRPKLHDQRTRMYAGEKAQYIF